ncbi:hypothetical protein AC578_1311 [Pseudocercospora eumusae]|uniref:NACHT domain-containing protein n=1 Tax=Pseudocercospora eumusae TaxID=321146 RepID=A0A139HUM3_9PEZI|nr:hypothetical protein AC578_1311 [Pseudocercospora eumusae]
MGFQYRGNNDYSSNTVHGGRVQFGDSYNFNQESEISKQERLRAEALKALYWTDPEIDLTKAEDRTRAGRTPGTCEWVLENEDFKKWQSAKAPQLLLITGEPGIGKTVLATFLVDHYKKQSASNGSDFSYFFCMNAEARQSTGLGILRGWLLLLLRKRPALCDHLLKDFAVKGEHLFDSIESLWPVFEAVISDDILGNLLLQIDGLDECDETSRDLLVSRLGGLMRRCDCKNMKVVITSRVVRTASDLASHFLDATQRIAMDIGKVNKDLQRFIEYEVNDIASKCGWGPDLKAEVTKQVKDRDGGTFVWVSLALKTVSKKRPYQVLDELSKLPLGLQNLYARILYEIPPDERDIVYRVLVLVIGAEEPMSLDELSIALHYYPDPSGSQTARRRLPTDKELDQGTHWVQTCAILLRMTEVGDECIRVNVFHLTLKEFLTEGQLPQHVSSYHIDQEQARKTLLAISTAYLRSEELDAIATDARILADMVLKESKYRQNNLPFKRTFRHLKVKNLLGRIGRRKEKEVKGCKGEEQEPQGKHREFELCKAWSEVEDRHLILLESAYRIQGKEHEATAIKQIQIMIWDPKHRTQGCFTNDDFLFVLCLMIENSWPAASRAIGIIWRLLILRDSFSPWDVQESWLQKSIAMAARSGRSDMLEAFVRLKPLQFISPRHIFAMVMQTFVSKGKPPVPRDQGAFDLLFSTARLDCIPDESSLLHSAARIRCSYLVKCCINAGDQVSPRDEFDSTPLHFLVGFGYKMESSESEAILCAQLILDADSERISSGARDLEGRSPLHSAARNYRRHPKLLQLLIDGTADYTALIAQDCVGRVPLHYAVEHGDDQASCDANTPVAALLQADHEKKSLHVADNEGKLPLHHAVKQSCPDCVKLLVEADVTRSTLLVQDREGRSPLKSAREKHHENQDMFSNHDALVKGSLEIIHYLSKATEEAQKLQEGRLEVAHSTTDSPS